MKCKECKYYIEETYPDCDCYCGLCFSIGCDEDGDEACKHTEADIQRRIKFFQAGDREYTRDVNRGEIEE